MLASYTFNITVLYKTNRYIFEIDIIHGKLDQKSKHLEVDYAIGRDIRKEDISEIVQTLQDWCDSCSNVLSCIEEQIQFADAEKLKRIKHKEAIDSEV